MSRKYYILTFLLFCAGIVFGQDVKFTATASKTQVGTGEQFEVNFALNANIDRFSPPDFKGFNVLSGPNQSTSMMSVNGNTTISSSYSYILTGTQIGDFTIGTAAVMVNGKRYNSSPIRIRVVKGQPVPQNNRVQGSQGQGGPDPDIISQNTDSDLSRSIFMRADVAKTSVYQGEQVILTYKLYTRIGIEDSQVEKLPDLNGFYSEDINKPNPQKPQPVPWHIETYKGLRYNVADVKQTILYAEHSGNLVIDPLSMIFLVRQPVASHDIMEQFFGGGSFKQVKTKVKSLPVTIHVKPLPDAGKPAGFAGAVGRFEIEASVDKTALKANESLNYKVTIKGNGNIKLLKTINAVFPQDFERYDPKITDTVTETVNGVAGSRFYNFLLIPRHHGAYLIDPVQFSYFNPATGRYASLTTKGFKVNVAKSAAENTVSSLASDKRDIKLLNKDIRYIKTGEGNLEKGGDVFFGSAGYYLLLALGPLACISGFIYRNKQRKANSDIVRVKSRKAAKEAARHLANAKNQLHANNAKEFYEDIFRGLYGYLGDKLNIPAAKLDRETIAFELKARLISEELIARLLDALDLCEMARYAPVTHISRQQVFDKATGIINDIENEI